MTRPNKALVAVAHGKPYVLVWSADVHTTNFIQDCGGSDEFFPDDLGADYASPADGIYTATMGIIDDGPGDWPGSREFVLQFVEFQPVTADEWNAHCRGEWPWDVGSDEDVPDAEDDAQRSLRAVLDEAYAADGLSSGDEDGIEP